MERNTIITNFTKAKMKAASDLEQLYPDKVVVDLRRTNMVLYKRISVRASENDMSVGDYVESLGFHYVFGQLGRPRKNTGN